MYANVYANVNVDRKSEVETFHRFKCRITLDRPADCYVKYFVNNQRILTNEVGGESSANL